MTTLKFKIGDIINAVGHTGYAGFYGKIKVLGITDLENAPTFQQNFHECWFGGLYQNYRPVEEKCYLYIGQYVESTAEVERGTIVVFSEGFLNIAKTFKVTENSESEDL